MPEFRAVVESDSPAADAEALREAGIELLGPWAAGVASAERLVEDDHDVSVLLSEPSPQKAAQTVKAIVGSDTRIEIIPVR